jgi:hypothetical protein
MLGGALECFFLGRKLRKEREERRNTEQKECVARRVPRAGGKCITFGLQVEEK